MQVVGRALSCLGGCGSRGGDTRPRGKAGQLSSARGTVRARPLLVRQRSRAHTHAHTRANPKARGRGGVHRLERWSSRCPMVQPPTPSESYHCAGCATPWGHHLSMWGTARAWRCSGGGRAARGLEERRGLAAREGNQVCVVVFHDTWCATTAPMWDTCVVGHDGWGQGRDGHARAGHAAQRREGDMLAMHTRRVHGLCACRAPLRGLTLCVVRLCRWRLDGLTAVTVALLMSLCMAHRRRRCTLDGPLHDLGTRRIPAWGCRCLARAPRPEAQRLTPTHTRVHVSCRRFVAALP